MKHPTAFISYSWDDNEHKEWVLHLSEILIEKYGIEVLLDQYELTAGNDLTYFMEKSIEKADKVLMILSPNYKSKSENRKGGAGYEYSMISQEWFESQPNNNKFIPILRKGNIDSSCPKYVKSKIYCDMRNNATYQKNVFDLARLIYDKPEIIKHQKGAIPNFDSLEIDPVLGMLNELKTKKELNNQLNIRLKSQDGQNSAKEELNLIFDKIKAKANIYNDTNTFNFIVKEDDESIVIFCQGFSVRFYWQQKYIDTVEDSFLQMTFWEGFVEVRSKSYSYFPGEEPKLQKEIKFSFDYNIQGRNIWKNDNKSMYSDELIQNGFIFIIENISKKESEKFRNK